MSVAKQANLKDRVTLMLWLGNAMVGVFSALLGAMILTENVAYDPQLSLFVVPAGALLAATGALLLFCAAWRFRQEP